MSREEYALVAMQALIPTAEGLGEQAPHIVATMAFAVADAMRACESQTSEEIAIELARIIAG